MTLYEITLLVVFPVWLVATICKHVPEKWLSPNVHALLNGGVACWLVPAWNFFAPTPGTASYRILYRDQFADGATSPWRELTSSPSPSWLRAVWNPEKTLRKGTIDVAIELARVVTVNRDSSAPVPEIVKLSIPYLTLLWHVSAHARVWHPTSTQFLLMQRQDDMEQVLFVSAVHAL
jgi:hypothetical protein